MTFLKTNDEFMGPGSTEPVLVVTDSGLPHHRVRVLDLSSNEEKVVRVSELRERINAGELSHRRPGCPRVSLAAQRDPALDAATSRALEEVGEVRKFSQRFDVSINQAYQSVQKKHASAKGVDGANQRIPSRATIYRRMKAQREGRPVLCGNANKGNQTPRYSDEVIGLIVDSARTLHQQQESRWTIKSLTEYCNQQARDAKLLLPSDCISPKFVKKVILTEVNSDADIARLPPHLRASTKAVAKNRIRVDGFLLRVEQDALHLPWQVQTPSGELRDLYWVHAIDVGTGLPVGWALSIGAPTSSTSLACVECILYSKQEIFAELGIHHLVADLYGTPSVLVLDNGPEAKNERVGGLVRLGIDVQYCKSNHPHHKPYIERLNRSLKEALETLPGCTRMDGEDGKRDPGALGDLPMPLDELVRWIVRWYFEEWALKPLKRLARSNIAHGLDLGITPLARLQSMEQLGRVVPLPPNRDDWTRVKYEMETRTLARTTGITVDTFQFRGNNLDRLIAHFGENEVSVLIDRDDFRTVHVVQGDELVELVNIDVSESTPAHSFEAAKAMEKAALEAARLQGAPIVEKFRRDVFSASLPGKGKLAGKRTAAKSSKQNREKHKHAQAVEKALLRPLPPAPTAADVSSKTEFSFDQLNALPVVDRRTGSAL